MIRMNHLLRTIGLAGLLGLSGCFEGELSSNETRLMADQPFAYVVRSYPDMGDAETINVRPPLDPRAPYGFNTGARLMIRDRIALNSTERHLLADYFGGAYDVKDLDVSPDGRHLIFAAHAPAGDTRNTTWNLFEYSFETGQIRRVFQDDAVANAGHDTNPTYTNEGRLIFSSSRQHARGNWQQLDLREYLEDFSEPASLLHSVNRDGTDLTQITFGQFHDIQPATMNDGQIVFIRFGRLYETLTDCTLENIDNPNFNTHPNGGGFGQGNGNGFPSGLEEPKEWTVEDKCGASLAGETEDERVFIEDVLSLYRITPSGGNVHRYFGSLSQEFSDASFIHYMAPIPLYDGNLLTVMRHIYNPVYGGDVVKINSQNFFAVGKPVADSITGDAEESMTPGLVNFYPNQVSPSGWYSAVSPYNDGSGRLLTSWAPCLTQSGSVSSPCQGWATVDNLGEPRYGIWMVDPANHTRLPVVQGHERALYTDIVIIRGNELARPYRGKRHQLQLEENTALFEIRSIYDMDGADMAKAYDGGILTRRDPSLTRPDDRSERFIRVLGHRDVPADLAQAILTNEHLNPSDGSRAPLGLTPLLGTGNRVLYDILSYAMVEPDGSALVRVPAETEFTFEVVNKYGKRVDLIAAPDYNYNYLVQHPRKLLLEDGEVLTCFGCHDPNADIPHARTDIELASANPGAPGDGMRFPNTHPDRVAFRWKDTMAQTLVDSLGFLPTTWADRMSFEDYWSRPEEQAPSFMVPYSDLETPAPVTDLSCLTNWRADCKATINYVEHIQPIWDRCRENPNQDDAITSCQNCHRAAVSQSCAGGGGGGGASTGLLLSNRMASWDGRQLESYVQLFQPHYYMKQEDGEWVEVADPSADGACPEGVQGDLTVLPDPGVCFARRLMSARGAIASARFFSLFDDDPDDDEYQIETDHTRSVRETHMGMLTRAELRLIAEWLDTSAHLYNDPDKFELPSP